MTDKDRLTLIQKLTNDLHPVKRHSSIGLPVSLWLLGSWAYVIMVAIKLGPIRTGAINTLTINPHFALESLSGLAVTALFAILAFRESIPGVRNQRILLMAVCAAVLWVGDHTAGLYAPALQPSMEGKRAHCVLEAFVYSGPPLLIGYWWLFQRFPLHSVRAGIYLGISAGTIPALLMQFACMYTPAHILTHHIGPIIVVVTAGAIIGSIFSTGKHPHPSRSQQSR